MSIKGPNGVILNKAYTTKDYAINEVVELKPDQNGENYGEYVFAEAGGAIDRGALCQLTYAGVATEQDTTTSGSTRKRDAIAPATLASGEYGFFWRGRGSTEALVATGISADAALTTTATAGELGAGGDAVFSLLAVDANSSGSTALRTVFADSYISTN